MKTILERRLTPLTAERLQRLEKADATRRRYSNLFPTDQSWKWFRRTRKAAMLQAGALIQTTAGDLIDPIIFDRVLPNLLTEVGRPHVD
ncbi:hypothetical protein MOJ79_18690 [Calidifontimicrobium sp. SYSU G02091]|uniref:hypothetical protein n=1 Tax=Calidifontimicrobium sp. SYSU G02091 TaxID=2926421 RepID=UPI001F53556C|nr:hypothetical protein [Calidifontimicrobium sp. SYSU G02091]MCI1193865.1 hypothetical protein [Calidifontimicrobium sp. SYSU G02091]